MGVGGGGWWGSRGGGGLGVGEGQGVVGSKGVSEGVKGWWGSRGGGVEGGWVGVKGVQMGG